MSEVRTCSGARLSGRRPLPAVLLLGIVVVWGWTFVVVKDAVAVYGVVPFLAVRFLIGAACLGGICARRMEAATLRTGGAIGLVVGVAFLLQTLGLDRSSASNTGLITGLFVVFAPLANRLLFDVRISGLHGLAIAVSLAGLALLTGAGSACVRSGDLLTLGCAALFGLHIALLDRYARGRDAAVLAFGQVGAAAALFAAVWLAWGRLAWPPPRVWPALVITGVVASAAAYLVQTYAQQRLSAVQTAMILLAEPLFAVMFGAWLQGDRFTPVQMAGAVLMVSAMVFVEVFFRRPSKDLTGAGNGAL